MPDRREFLKHSAGALATAALAARASAERAGVRFERPAAVLDAWDYVEVVVRVQRPDAPNPFVDAEVRGTLTGPRGRTLNVDGFCDSEDGTVHRIRFMPTAPGRHRYTVTYRDRAGVAAATGAFTARRGRRRGGVRVDPAYPWHFVWAATGERYFYNGTTAYWLAGNDDARIQAALDRLARLRVNRVRAALSGRVRDGRAWHEEVFASPRFRFVLDPWPAARPDDVENPGYDITRFHLPFWRRYEGMVRHARGLDMVVSIIFYVDGARPGVYPFPRTGPVTPDEERFYRYAAARFAAFSNVMWDVTNEWHLFRNEPWVRHMGAYLRSRDPYGHLISVHGHGEFPFRSDPWADYALHQSWDEHGGHAFMLQKRRQQADTGRPMPQVNEEYGYEDHYPPWGGGKLPPARSPDNRRRLAWGMVMAGGYQTTGERATPAGGWINGYGDDTMTMLVGYGHMRAFFESFPWWRCNPRNELTDSGAMCLAEPGRTYALYLPEGRPAALQMAAGRYRVREYDPAAGTWRRQPNADGAAGPWRAEGTSGGADRAYLLERR